jgi:DNA-binding XRE family transcriptional regulator
MLHVIKEMLPMRQMESAMTGDELKDWRKTLGMTQALAADALGISRSTLAAYESEELQKRQERPVGVPPLVELACNLILRSAQGEALLRLVRAQHADLAEHVSFLGDRVERLHAGPRVLAPPALRPEIQQWMEDNCPSARFSMRRLILGFGAHRAAYEIPVIEFDDSTHQFLFTLKWG